MLIMMQRIAVRFRAVPRSCREVCARFGFLVRWDTRRERVCFFFFRDSTYNKPFFAAIGASGWACLNRAGAQGVEGCWFTRAGQHAKLRGSSRVAGKLFRSCGLRPRTRLGPRVGCGAGGDDMNIIT